MCGIAGVINSSEDLPAGRSILEDMLKSIYHRGPDDEGVYLDDDAALGIRRLSIIDLKTGHQPIHNEDKSVWIVYNGEIYNFPELKEELRKKGHNFYTETDTEVIIHLYEEYGFDCVEKLSGMFAFAIWDKRKKSLFLARDRFGIKPLYYSDAASRFIFASEIKPILKFPGFSKELDLYSLDKYLSFDYVPAPFSIFANIKKLPAGHILIYKDNQVILRRYWDVFSAKNNVKYPGNKKGIEEKLLYLLKKSVTAQLRSDVSWGIFLSGGIDSAAILALASGSFSKRIKTFSVKFKDKSFDESSYSSGISRLYDTEHHCELFDVNDVLSLLDDESFFPDEPIADPSLLPAYFLAKFSRRKVTVALSGDGGDELFAGYPTYQAHKLARYYRYLPKFLRSGLIEKVIAGMPVSMKNFSFDFKAKQFIRGADYPLGMRHCLWMGAFSQQEKDCLYSGQIRDYLEKADTFMHLNDYLNRCPARKEQDILQYLDMKTYLQDDLLVKVDRASMMNSLEVRVPYLDHELAEFAFQLPAGLRLHSFTTKYILKRALKPLLPGQIINRRKKGFGIPLGFWIQNELREKFSSVLLDEAHIKRQGLFNYRHIEELLNQHIKNKRDNRKKLWPLFMLLLWCKKNKL